MVFRVRVAQWALARGGRGGEGVAVEEVHVVVLERGEAGEQVVGDGEAVGALGYHGKTTSRLRKEAGGTWSRYAPGDHTGHQRAGFLAEDTLPAFLSWSHWRSG